MAEILDNPEHWRKRAEEARALAENMRDPAAKRMMLRLAGTYDHLAIKAAKRGWPTDLPDGAKG